MERNAIIEWLMALKYGPDWRTKGQQNPQAQALEQERINQQNQVVPPPTIMGNLGQRRQVLNALDQQGL